MRSLGKLEREIRRHIAALHKIECEDAEASEAIIEAIGFANESFAKCQAAKKECWSTK